MIFIQRRKMKESSNQHDVQVPRGNEMDEGQSSGAFVFGKVIHFVF